MSDDKLTLQEWADELMPKHKRLTREDAALLLAISTNNLLVSIEAHLEDLENRYSLLDRWLEDTAPGYRAPEHLKRLREGG